MPQHNHATIGATQPLSTVNATYAEVSSKRILGPGEKIKDLWYLNTTKPYFLQRLSERAYFFGGGFYTTTFYVGDKGVLLLDAPEKQGKNILQAIAEVTNLPVTAIVYSHNHADHIISAKEVLEASNAAGVEQVRIIASTETDAKMKLLKCTLPPPTETVDWPSGSFQFEDVTVQLSGFTRGAHCDDAGAWLLVQEKVVHLPDLLNGDQPPFWRFATAENYVYYRPNINQLGGLDWIHHVGGHGNVGSKEDIRFYNSYLDDLEAAVGEAMASAKFGALEDMQRYNNHAQLMMPWLGSICAMATDKLRPKYGTFYGFDISTPANAEMVALSMVSYR
ncbi:hydrolase [Ilyonectria robusta]